MRSLALLFCALLLGATAAARADSLADLRLPSSTVPGCVNHWGPFGTGSGIAEPTCEGKAARAEWNEHATAINAASDILARAANFPDKAAPLAIIGALDACAAAVDAMARLYHPAPSAPHDDAAVVAWMRTSLEQSKLPSPVTIGDGFRAVATGLARPGLRHQERNTLYGLAAMFASRESVLAAERGAEVERRTDNAVRAAHFAALKAAENAESGHPQRDAGTAIAAAAGPGHPALAQRQTAQLVQSLAAHPDQGRYRARTARALAAIPGTLLGILGLAVILVVVGFRSLVDRLGTRGAVGFSLLLLVALPVSWLPLALLHAVTGWPGAMWLGFLLWLALAVVLLALGPLLLPGRLRRGWAILFTPAPPTTHGSAYFGAASDAAARGHLKPAAPAELVCPRRPAKPAARPRPLLSRRPYPDLRSDRRRQGYRRGDPEPARLSRFRLCARSQEPAPAKAGGENYAVAARARRASGQDVFLIDPFAITGAASHALNLLDTLDPDHPDVVSRAGTLADMLVVRSGFESEPHWNDTARDLLRGFLVHVAGLPAGQRNMAELRAILTAPEDQFAEILADMLAAPERGGQSLVSRTAATHLSRPERERGSVLSTAQRHTAWLDDPRLCAALSGSDFSLHDLKRRPMTVYLAIPPDRLRASLGFVRGFIGLALHVMTAVPGRPSHRVAFFLDEFGQLGRLDALVDGLTLMRGYGVQLWLFVQDLSQLKAVYPRWQSFLANTSQQYFGTADYDTAHYISNAHDRVRDRQPLAPHQPAVQTRDLDRRQRPAPDRPTLVDPRRDHAPRTRPPDRHDRRRAALPARAPRLPLRPRLRRPRRPQPDALPRRRAVRGPLHADLGSRFGRRSTASATTRSLRVGKRNIDEGPRCSALATYITS